MDQPDKLPMVACRLSWALGPLVGPESKPGRWEPNVRYNEVKVQMSKRKLTPQEKAAKKRRRLEYEYIFLNGKQVRVKRPPLIDGQPVEDWLQQNELWDLMTMEDK